MLEGPELASLMEAQPAAAAMEDARMDIDAQQQQEHQEEMGRGKRQRKQVDVFPFVIRY